MTAQDCTGQGAEREARCVLPSLCGPLAGHRDLLGVRKDLGGEHRRPPTAPSSYFYFLPTFLLLLLHPLQSHPC